MIPFENSTYIYVNDIPIKTFKFSGGEIQVKIPEQIILDTGNVNSVEVSVKAFLLNSDAIIELLLIKDALKRCNAYINELFIPYFPYARQDRVCNKGEAFSLSCVLDLFVGKSINSIKVYDIHSDVILKLLFDKNTSFENILPNMTQFFETKYDYVIAPDKGSKERAEHAANILGIPAIYASKHRDSVTGQIISTDILTPINAKKVIIVDDICDGGGTFLELAKVMKYDNPNISIDLFVTHGIFSRGFEVFRGYIDNVFYMNTRNQDSSGIPDIIHHVNILEYNSWKQH